MALVIASVLTPVSAPILPESVAGPVDAGVKAQSAIVGGTPDPCPSNPPGFAPDGSNCVLTVDACPQSPVTGMVMRASVTGYPKQQAYRGGRILRYPHFCEEQILEKSDPGWYSACTALTGYVVMTHPMEEQLDAQGDIVLDANGNPALWNMCRLLTTPTCSFGLNRVDSEHCNVVIRRTWQCPTGTLPRNVFNSCYRPAPRSGAHHPACGPGAPDLVAVDCEDYVGEDYARSPASQACAGFDTGDSLTALSDNTLTGSAAVWWCEFNPNHLKSVCQGAAPPPGECAPAVARCLKRASGMGGCSEIARTLYCRGQQAAHDAGTLTAEEVRADGCEPCVVLPFESDLSACPADIHQAPVTASTLFFDVMHREKQSFYYDAYNCRFVRGGDPLSAHPACRNEVVCDGTAPQGRLTWSSGHDSGLAIVDAPVVLRIEDVPSQYVTRYRTEFIWAHGNPSRSRLYIHQDSFLRFDNNFDPHGDESLVRVWPLMNQSTSYGRVKDFLNNYNDVSDSCLIRGRPQFRVTIRELRPDDPEDHAEILRMFGPGSLDWWANMPVAERRRRTEARGLQFWPDLATAAAEAQERARRDADLSEELRCTRGSGYWCRWAPRRPGYYTATAGGAWRVLRPAVTRQWLSISVVHYVDYFIALLGYLDSFSADVEAAARSRGLTMEELGLRINGLGRTDPTLYPGRYGLIPFNDSDHEWLYSEGAGLQLRCPSTDLRIFGCGVPKIGGNYTESAAIGIEVSEIRVAARSPNR